MQQHSDSCRVGSELNVDVELHQEKKRAEYNNRLGYSSIADRAGTDTSDKQGTDDLNEEDLEIEV